MINLTPHLDEIYWRRKYVELEQDLVITQALADKRLVLLKAAKSWLESYLEYLDNDSPLGDEPNNSLAKLIDELAEAIAEE